MAVTLKQRLEHAEAMGFRAKDLAAFAGVSSSAAAQWKTNTKRLKGESALGLARGTGWPVEWWQTGRGELPTRRATDPDTELGVANTSGAGLSQVKMLRLETLTWTEFMRLGDPPDIFILPAPDDALAPDIRTGTQVIWATQKQAKPGAPILVRDKEGAVHMRCLHQGLREHHFIAAAKNAAYRSLDSEESGLKIVAVWHGRISDFPS